MKVLLAGAYYPPALKAGGPVRSISGLVTAESAQHKITIVTSDRDLGDTRPMEGISASPVARDGATVHYRDSSRTWRLLQLFVRLGRRQSDILYLNSLFSFSFSILPLALWRLGLIRARLLIIAPRGELSHSALAIKSTKKAAVLPLLRLALSGTRITWQATSETELVDIQRFSKRARIVRHDNPWPQPKSSPPTREGPLRLAYVGRIAAIKNPITAILALKDVRTPLTLTMAGVPESPALQSACEAAARHLGPNVNVDFVGHQSSEGVQLILENAHGLILPTSGENFGHAIAEALAQGCVILVPRTTPWSPLIAEGAGHFISPQPSSLNVRLLSQLASETEVSWIQRSRQALTVYDRHWRKQVERRQSLFDSACEMYRTGTQP